MKLQSNAHNASSIPSIDSIDSIDTLPSSTTNTIGSLTGYNVQERLIAFQSYNIKRIPKSMPYLYPGPPLWLNTDYECPTALKGIMSKVKKRKCNCKERWAYLWYCYGYLGETIEYTFKQHQVIHKRAGVMLTPLCHYSSAMTMDLESLTECDHAPDTELLSGFDIPDVIYTKCAVCCQLTLFQCICGAHYCSIPCQLLDYRHHKDKCDSTIENEALNSLMTMESWKHFFKAHPDKEIKRQKRYRHYK